MTEAQTPRREWTVEQRRVVDAWGKGCAVSAGAGSGKTSTLVEKCEELLRRDSEARFVAVSFTEKSAAELRTRLASKMGLDRHWVMTIHGLCSAILREEPRAAGLVGEERVLSETESSALWERALDRLWRDDLPGEIAEALDLLLERQGRKKIVELLARGRSLRSFGVLESLARAPDPQSRALDRLLSFVLHAYERGKTRAAALDFDDLERRALEALRSERVRREFHQRFDLVMVDEFQDTNPVQAQVIWAFARPDQSNLCVVGDPKQSIYRFRDADVSLFSELCSRLPERLSLTRNFRSRPGILEYSNAVCGRVFPASNLEYEALTPVREASGEDEVLELHLERPEALASWLWSEVRAGKRLSDFVVLVRKLRGATHWLEALERARVPIAIASGGFFWEDPRVREIVALLKAWRQPGNVLSAAVFLRAPWVGVADPVLDTWIRERKEPLLEHFFETDHPLARRLRSLRARTVRPGEIVAALLEEEEPEAQLGYAALGLWHRAETLSFEGRDFASVVREFTRSIEAERREREVPPPANLESLKVMTIHGSKGLEFPHVILLDFASDLTRAPRARSPSLFWDRERGAFLAPRDADGELDRESAEYAEWKELERSKELAENKRLFYVALTRAQERLITVFFPNSSAKEQPKEPFDRREDWRAWIEGSDPPRVVRTHSESSQEFRWSSSTAPRALEARARAPSSGERRSRTSVTEWNLHLHCPRAYEWTYLRPPAARPVRDDTKDRGDGPAQNEIGTRVHAALERMDRGMLEALEAELGSERFRAGPVVEWMEQSPWMRPTDLARGWEAWAELAFEAPVPTRNGMEVLVGSLDRLTCDRGEYVVLDFKITRGEKSAEALRREYQGQLELYAWAVAALEPAAKGRIRARLVHVSPSGVREIDVPLSGIDLSESLERMGAIVSGTSGVPHPSERCRYCDFLAHCPEGSLSLS